MFEIELFINCLASECKTLFDKLTEEKPKPITEVPKVKPPPPPTRDRRSAVKSVKSKEEPVAKAQTEEKLVPAKVDNYKNYNYDYATPPATSDLPTEQSYSSGYNSLSQTNSTPGYNGTYPYSYNR